MKKNHGHRRFGLNSVCLVTLTAGAHAHEATQWRAEDGGNGHWYEVIETDQALCWEEFRILAEANAGDFASLETMAEMTFACTVARCTSSTYPSVHIGLLQDEDGAEPAGGWRWLSGEPLTYNVWASTLDDAAGCQDRAAFASGSGAGGFDDIYPCDEAGCLHASYHHHMLIEYSADCNGDGIVDYGQILDGVLPDTNGNGVPDECEHAGGNEDDLWVWGRNADGECDVPEDLLPIVEVEGTGYHVLVLQVDGSIRCWGRNSDGQCDPPNIGRPWVDVAGGDQHSIGLDADGRVHCWGDNTHGQCDVPSDLPTAIAVGTGANHSLAVLADGSVVNWGYDRYGSLDIPSGLLGVVKVTGGSHHSIALREDGSIVAWGGNDNESEIPGGHVTFVDVKVSQYNSIALTSDGDVVAWGRNWYGQTNVPNDLGEATLIGIGAHFAMARTADNEIVCWGNTSNNECVLPDDLLNADNLGSSNLHGTAWIESPLQIDDCNGDGIVDYGQIRDGTFADDNGNGVPDCCDDGSICGCPADLNQDDVVNGGDLSILLGWWGIDSETSGLPDLTADGRVNGEDLTVLLGSWGPCR